MSGTDGADICRSIKSDISTAHISVIIFSANPDVVKTFINSSVVSSVNVYLLKMVDVDGQFKYSPVASVKLSALNQFRIGPNPLRDKIKIAFFNQQEQLIRFQVVNMQGQVVVEEQQYFSRGEHQKSLQFTRAASPGAYLLVITTADEVFTTKLVNKLRWGINTTHLLLTKFNCC
ncbi:MAG: hypothetical protein C4308_00540 [Chitinophagaceae bacterium]